MARHNGAELPPLDRFEQIRKDAIEMAHARPCLNLGNHKGRFPAVRRSMHRDTADHPADSPALLGRGSG
jgi:hypothetical protein